MATSVTFSTNADGVIAQLEARIRAMKGTGTVQGKVFTIVGYAPHVEYGTKNPDGSVRMSPRAMVRSNIPAVKAFVRQKILQEKPMSRAATISIVNQALAFAHSLITLDTPVDTGNLKGSWTIQKAGD